MDTSWDPTPVAIRQPRMPLFCHPASTNSGPIWEERIKKRKELQEAARKKAEQASEKPTPEELNPKPTLPSTSAKKTRNPKPDKTPTRTNGKPRLFFEDFKTPKFLKCFGA
ncbi:hypothetical protein TNIN_342271 [Trichonephila inaurata madagascariensis]|uniref:Uncharacterized protein n=1 Tax=Trichonephila inaurata madagascariensis TaxID=2747483 RepID=A0A8X7CMB8_9ARAC|nr:hypothetical protein TNIN_342271 [Trichonephila inaurata madagascariensis]